jgi:general secretion pathway protein M
MTMRISLPSGRTGQSLALALPVIAVVALWVGVAMPLMEWHVDRNVALTHLSVLAGRMEGLAATVPALREQATAVAANGTGEPALLEGDSDSTASASLQERLQAMFLQAGVQLNTVETVPGEEAGAFRRIRLRVSFNASWPTLMALLKDMQLATPLLLVDELQIQPALHRISTAPGTYDISCSVFAFRPGSATAGVR